MGPVLVIILGNTAILCQAEAKIGLAADEGIDTHVRRMLRFVRRCHNHRHPTPASYRHAGVTSLCLLAIILGLNRNLVSYDAAPPGWS